MSAVVIVTSFLFVCHLIKESDRQVKNAEWCRRKDEVMMT